jgi:hypothetical protein
MHYFINKVFDVEDYSTVGVAFSLVEDKEGATNVPEKSCSC